MSINTAQSLKKEGSQLLLDKKYEAAIDKYTEALDLEPTGTLLWEIISNRSLAYTSSRDYTNGLMDANKLIDIAPRFKRSYLRLAQALLGRQEFNDALKACDDGLAIDSTNQELVKLRSKIASSSSAASDHSYTNSRTANSGSSKLAKYSFYLRAVIMVHVLLYVVPGYNATAFFRIMICSLINNIIVIGAHLGSPTASSGAGMAPDMGAAQAYMQKLVQNDTTRQAMQYIMYSVIFAFSKPFFLALFPVITIDGWWFAKTLGIFYPSAGKFLGGVAKPLVDAIFKEPGQTHVTLDSLASKIQPFNANVEVMIGMFLIFELFTPYRNFITLIVFWNFMKMRYMLDPYVKHSFVALDGMLSPVVSRIPIVGGLYPKLKAYMATFVAPPTPGQSSGCTVM
eukprot:Stramenopile-MAST_4_protein_3706